jgi:hypothetical protein
MNRRLLTMTLLCLAVVSAAAFPQVSFAQSNPWIGTWKLNVAKSTFSPGQGPRSRTVTYQAEGQGLRATIEAVQARGGLNNEVLMVFDDGRFYPVTVNPGYDAAAFKRVNDTTIWGIRTKAGKVVQTIISVVSSDGKTETVTQTGVTADGRQLYNVLVSEKQ